MADHLIQEDGELTGTDDGYLFLNDGPETRPVIVGEDYTVSQPPSGACDSEAILTLAEDHSWLGYGLVSIDGQPAVNATLSLRPTVEAKPVSSLTLGVRPTQWAWRVTGWNVDLQTSDLTAQILQLAMAGAGPLCLQARLENSANSQLGAITVMAQVVWLPSQEKNLLSDNGFYQQRLSGRVAGVPAITQEFRT